MPAHSTVLRGLCLRLLALVALLSSSAVVSTNSKRSTWAASRPAQGPGAQPPAWLLPQLPLAPGPIASLASLLQPVYS